MTDFEDIQINVEDEIRRVAEKDGVTNPKMLEVPMTMTRHDYYKASVVQWYRGRDQGYSEGLASIGPTLERRLRNLFILGCVFGATLTAIVFILVGR